MAEISDSRRVRARGLQDDVGRVPSRGDPCIGYIPVWPTPYARRSWSATPL